MASEAERFAEAWVSDNVHNVPGLLDLSTHIAHLRAQFIADAGREGYTTAQLESALGDIDDFLTPAYENVHDPELGFRD